MSPRPLLLLEGGGVLALSLVAYWWNHGSWGLFALLFLLPDISIIGYAAGSRAGAIMYNAAHTYLGPLLLGGFAIRFDNRGALLFR